MAEARAAHYETSSASELAQAPGNRRKGARAATVTLTAQEVDEFNRFIEAFNDVAERILHRLDRIHVLVQDINRDLHGASSAVSEAPKPAPEGALQHAGV